MSGVGFWQPQPGGGVGGGSTSTAVVKAVGTGNMTSTTTMAAMDATDLPYAGAFTLGVGDEVVCSLTLQFYATAAVGNCNLFFDIQVDQPTSGDVFANAIALGAATIDTAVGTNRQTRTYEMAFVATEAGVHSFRPAWKHENQAVRACNASSGGDGTPIIWRVTKV